MSKKNVNLTAKWQLDAALLSRPVDLTALVSMSRSTPDKFLDDNTLQRLVTLLLNEKNKVKSDKDTKLDVLNILANVAAGSKKAVAEVLMQMFAMTAGWFSWLTSGCMSVFGVVHLVSSSSNRRLSGMSHLPSGTGGPRRHQ